jgi:putative transcriptional regulator
VVRAELKRFRANGSRECAPDDRLRGYRYAAGLFIVNQTLTRITDHWGLESGMQRLRLKADGRIVELRDGREFPLVPAEPFAALPTISVALATTFVAPETAPPTAVRDLRKRARLTQQEFAARLGVPVETIRNWEQGKRMPRGPARALLAVIAHAPETVFAALARA